MEIYAHPASQPSRAVLWFCAIAQVEGTITANPTLDLSAHNPRQQLPLIEHDGFYLSEMPAILSFLANLTGTLDWLPSNLVERARIDSYLHSHHSLTRLATLKLMAPHVLTAFESPPLGPETSRLNNEAILAALADPQKLATGQALLREVCRVFETAYLIKQSHYIGGLSHPSIADLAAYEELAQLRWAGLFDFSAYHAIEHWLDQMEALPHHDHLHQFNITLGDVCQQEITMARFGSAIDAGLRGLIAAGLSLSESP